MRTLGGEVRAGHSTVHDLGDWIGTGVSGTFLYVIAALNLVVLWGIIKVFLEMRGGCYDEQALEEQLRRRGLMNRFFARLGGAISAPWQTTATGLLTSKKCLTMRIRSSL